MSGLRFGSEHSCSGAKNFEEPTPPTPQTPPTFMIVSMTSREASDARRSERGRCGFDFSADRVYHTYNYCGWRGNANTCSSAVPLHAFRLFRRDSPPLYHHKCSLSHGLFAATDTLLPGWYADGRIIQRSSYARRSAHGGSFTCSRCRITVICCSRFFIHRSLFGALCCGTARQRHGR